MFKEGGGGGRQRAPVVLTLRKPRLDRPPSPARHNVHTWVTDRNVRFLGQQVTSVASQEAEKHRGRLSYTRSSAMWPSDVITTTTPFNGQLSDLTMRQFKYIRRQRFSLGLLLVFGSHQGQAVLKLCGQPRLPLALPIQYCCSPSSNGGPRMHPSRSAVFLSGPALCWFPLSNPEGFLWRLLRDTDKLHLQEKGHKLKDSGVEM